MLKEGDNIVVERKTGYNTIGRFVSQDDAFIVVEGTVGQSIGKTILIPLLNVDQITALHTSSAMKPEWMTP